MKKQRIPKKYTVLFEHVFKLKAILQSNSSVINISDKFQVVMMFMVLHYITFLVNCIGEYNKTVNKELSHYIRLLIEGILAGDGYNLNEVEINKLISFCDQSAKYVNTTPDIYMTICSYEAYCNYSIYSELHNERKIFDYKYCCMVSDEMVNKMKSYYDIAIKMLNGKSL